MPYIIPITVISALFLVLTTVQKTTTKKNGKSTKKIVLNKAAIIEISRELIIVFLSAMLAMWLTEYVEHKTVKNRAQAFSSQIHISVTSQITQVGGVIHDAYETQEPDRMSYAELFTSIIKQIEQDDMNFLETMLYNESFLTTLNPMSYMHLNMDFTQLKNIKNELLAANLSATDKQQVCDWIASYLYYCTDAAFCFEFLSENIEFNLIMLATLDDEYFDSNIYYSLYNDYIVQLEALFQVDLENWHGKRQFNSYTHN